MFGRGVSGVTQLGSVLFLARLLSPEEYGLVAMVTAVTGFAQIVVDLGTRDAIVQRDLITEGEVSALFWINLAVGFVLAGLVAACGPAISAFYHEPRLTRLALVSATTFILAALGSQHQGLLRRVGMFRDLTIIETTATFVSICVAIGMALAGFGYWALAVRPVSLFAFLAIGVWWRSRWVPGLPTFTPGVKDMIRFGMNLMGYSISDYSGRASQRVAIGRGLGARTLGFYQNALLIYDNVMDLMVSSLHSVAVSGLSKLRSQPEELKRSWGSALATVSFYAMPIYGILAVTGQDVVVLLLGKKWTNAGMLLSIVALRGIPHVFIVSTGWLYVTAGQTRRWMHFGWFATVVQLLALICALPFGNRAVAAAYAGSMYLLFFPAANYAGRPLGIGMADVIRVLWRQTAGALAAAAVGLALRYLVWDQSNALPRSLLLLVVYLAIYLVLVVGIFGLLTPLRVTQSMIGGFFPGRLAKANAPAS